jgi:hypothetical protein
MCSHEPCHSQSASSNECRLSTRLVPLFLRRKVCSRAGQPRVRDAETAASALHALPLALYPKTGSAAAAPVGVSKRRRPEEPAGAASSARLERLHRAAPHALRGWRSRPEPGMEGGGERLTGTVRRHSAGMTHSLQNDT